jgi:hypothetical protein
MRRFRACIQVLSTGRGSEPSGDKFANHVIIKLAAQLRHTLFELLPDVTTGTRD